MLLSRTTERVSAFCALAPYIILHMLTTGAEISTVCLQGIKAWLAQRNLLRSLSGFGPSHRTTAKANLLPGRQCC